jgi:ribosomal protein S21
VNKFNRDRNPGSNDREYKGYYVDVTRSGGDAIRAFRKLKRKYKDTRFFEEMRERQYFQKPSEIKREAKKRKAATLKKLQRDRNNDRFIGRTRG